MPFDFKERFRHGSSPVHRLDPRAKVVGLFLFILSANLVPDRSWTVFALLLLVLYCIVLTARMGFSLIIRRSLAALPFVLAALAIPFTTPGTDWFALPGLGWTVSVEGAERFASILLRFWIAIQAAILLAAVTPFPDMLWALGKLRLPSALVSIIGFMYRYIFVIGDEATRMMRARAARCAQLPGSRRPGILWQARIAGLMVGSLFLRALARSERIHAAMLSRGYDGSARTAASFRLVSVDWIVMVLLGALLVSICVWRIL